MRPPKIHALKQILSGQLCGDNIPNGHIMTKDGGGRGGGRGGYCLRGGFWFGRGGFSSGRRGGCEGGRGGSSGGRGGHDSG
ncbi:unnamed protein product [Angiostrongylus costaricensis]|uniref:Uncharacterized protein n=1 Tax=Angiostrongylus costaricensis TaxID=334426 RepID=A0A0R3PN48_ANGCS|nr:unnamed protein product [Angiostrongylus costaricensis]